MGEIGQSRPFGQNFVILQNFLSHFKFFSNLCLRKIQNICKEYPWRIHLLREAFKKKSVDFFHTFHLILWKWPTNQQKLDETFFFFEGFPYTMTKFDPPGYIFSSYSKYVCKAWQFGVPNNQKNLYLGLFGVSMVYLVEFVFVYLTPT